MTPADKIRALRAEGRTPAQIVAELGVSYQRVASALQHTRAPGRPRVTGRCSHCGALPSHQTKSLAHYTTLERAMMLLDECGRSQLADSIRDVMDKLWYEHLTAAERAQLNSRVLPDTTSRAL
jgi:DTW domain-containing protein YfiP